MRQACPICGSSLLARPDGAVSSVYTLEPVMCEGCGVKLETRLFLRLWLPALTTPLFALAILTRFVHTHAEKVALGVGLAAVVVGAVLALAAAVALDASRPWSLVAWDEGAKWRLPINYFCLYGTIGYIVIFLALQGRLAWA